MRMEAGRQIDASWSARVKKKKTMKKQEGGPEKILHRGIVSPEEFFSESCRAKRSKED